jgi:hypothetical protein
MIRSAPLLLALAGCAAATAAPEPAPPPEGKCDIAPLQRFVGQPATADLAAEAQRLSGARTVRWKAPGMAVTMDYRPDRLNIEIDAAQKVVSFDCG